MNDFETVGYKCSDGFTVYFNGTFHPEIPNIQLVSQNGLKPISQISKPVQRPQTSGKKRIKVLCNWADTKQLIKDWSHMFLAEHSQQLELVYEEPIDYYIIINKPSPAEKFIFIPSKTIVFRMEPDINEIDFYNDWLADISRDKFMYFLDHSHFRNNTEWWIKQVDSIQPKTKLFSTVVSSQYKMKGHKLRIEFIKFIQLLSTIQLDVFGSSNDFKFKNYHGALPPREKDDGILPYKYHFAAENTDLPNYFTEKLYDAIIGESLLFYWGCPNVEEFIDSRAFIRLNLNDFQTSLDIIEKAITNNEWEKRLDIIRHEKSKIIYNLNFFSRINSLITTEQIKLYNVSSQNESGSFTFTIPAGFKNVIVPKLAAQSTVKVNKIIKHISTWQQAIENNQVIGVFDSSNPGVNFLDHVTTILSSANKSSFTWDIIFLSRQSEPEVDFIPNPILIKITGQITDEMFNGYIINPSRLDRVITYIKTYGYPSSLSEIFKIFPSFQAYTYYKQLIL